MEKSNNLEKETKEIMTFYQDAFRIDYQNSSKVYYAQENNFGDVKVNNYLYCQEGQKFLKTTEIFYQNKIICIEDKFQVSIDSVNLDKGYEFNQGKNEIEGKNSSRTNEKSRILNKKTNKHTRLHKKDKKNIVKNTVKLFLCWLQKKESHRFNSLYENSRKELEKMIKSENFNNTLILKVIASNEVSKAFLEFVEQSAEDKIKCSRIQDKESHYEAIKKYKILLTKKQSNKTATASNNEASEQNKSTQGLIYSSGSQENMNCSEKCSGNGCNFKEAGFKTKRSDDHRNKITVIQNELFEKESET